MEEKDAAERTERQMKAEIHAATKQYRAVFLSSRQKRRRSALKLS